MSFSENNNYQNLELDSELILSNLLDNNTSRLENLVNLNLEENYDENLGFIPWFEDEVFMKDLESLSRFNLDFDFNNQLGGELSSLKPIINETYSKKWKCTEKTLKFSLNNKEYENFFEANREINLFFKHIFEEYLLPINADHYVRYVIDHDSFSRAINSAFIKRKEISISMMQDHFNSVLQSRKAFENNLEQIKHLFTFSFKTIPNKIIEGGSNIGVAAKRPSDPSDNKKTPKKKICKEKKEIIDMNDFIHHSKYVVVVNFDNLCLVRAILIGKAFDEKETGAKNLTKPNCRKLNQRVNILVKELDIPDGFLNLKTVTLLEDYFKDYQITVYDSIENGGAVLYPSLLRSEELKCRKLKKFINIMYANDHFNVIISMTAYLGCKYYCQFCRVKYSNLGYHICENICKSCHRYSYKCEALNKKKCKNCGLNSNNKECDKLHHSSQCRMLRHCNDCGQTKSRRSGHVCKKNEKWCPNCKKTVTIEHKCFIKKEDFKRKNIKSFAGKIWFDIEAYVNNQNFHEANLIMAKRLCKICQINKTLCNKCNKKYEFESIKDFVKWVLMKENKNFIFISHNGKNYDNYFVMRYLQKCRLAREGNINAVVNGSKVMSFSFRSRVFKDSSLFITKPLEAFPKIFDIKELVKGFFPHKFNRPENFSYVGKYPDKEFYSPEFFSQEKKKLFESWYESVKDKKFDFQKEIRDYCWSDVVLLAEGCQKFSELNKEASKLNENDQGLDPFETNLTISSFCNTIYRRNFMPDNSIAWIPASGYDPKQNTSIKAMNWLKYVSEKENIFIQHAKNMGEKRIGKYLVDGYCGESKKIFEFQGCAFHGCLKCMGEFTFNPIVQCSNFVLRKRTEDKIKFLKETKPDFEIIEIYEHEWDKFCFENSIFIKTPKNILNVRDALYGGRTNAIKLHHKCKENEKIHYYDYTSLYPAVQKYGVFPKGHPKILTENFDYQKEYFGIIKCKVLPPKGLYIPVLPVNIDGKLLFPLCNKCAKEKNTESECNHQDDERALEGTWVSLELYKALELGYRLVEYYSIFHFEEKFEYNPNTKKGGLFADYVNQNLKEKQESSGFPSHCITEEAKAEYIKSYYEVEGINLEYDKIKKNPGKRNIAKDKLNSLWGYFALNSDKAQFKIVTNRAEIESMLNDDQFVIHDIDTKDENFAQVVYSVNENFLTGSLYSNVIIASFVTAQGRLKLFDEINKLGLRVLYFDTDSIIFTSTNGDYMPKLGDFLGQFTNELNDGEYIVEFVSGGPKNYAFKTNKGSIDCTVKGYPINYLTNLILNFESIKNCVITDRKSKITIPQLKFIKDKSEWLIKTEILNKEYRFIYDKRVLKDDLSTLPFGF